MVSPRIWVASIFLLLAFRSSAAAEIMVGESLEWLVDSSPHIGIYRVRAEKLDSEADGALKGTPPANVASPPQAPEKSERLLVFFIESGGKAEVRTFINLSHPPHRGFRHIAITKDFRVLIEGESIVKRVRSRVAVAREVDFANPQALANVFHEHGNGALRVEGEGEAFDALYSGSACYLVVPADPEFRRALVQKLKSKDVWERARAASRLVAFPGQWTRARLFPLLRDPESVELEFTQDGKRGTRRVYPARVAAYRALLRLGVKLKSPAGVSKDLSRTMLQ